MSAPKRDFAYALKSFLGYLEGTSKAEHTIESYRSDLLSFQEFLKREGGKKAVSLSKITLKDLDHYHQYLKKNGFKTNTRRRKLLTVRRFIRYLNKRNQIQADFADQVPAPFKVERVPLTTPLAILLSKVQTLHMQTPLSARNRTLLWTLCETGCLVSECVRMRFDQWSLALDGKSAFVKIEGKAERVLPVSVELYETVQDLKSILRNSPWLFQGFNKFGPMTQTCISSRGVELLVKGYAKALEISELTPRMIRHSVVLHWYQQGLDQAEIQKRLGLKTTYAFRAYNVLFKKVTPNSETMSIE